MIYPDGILEIDPDQPDPKALGAVSYMGVPLLDLGGVNAARHWLN